MTDQVEDQDVELDEEIEEAHDPKNAEAESLAANDKAEEAGPKAKTRKGDKKNSQPSELKKAAMKAESVDIDGNFRLSFAKENRDSVIIEVRFVGYETFTKTVKLNKSRMKFGAIK